MPTRAQSVCHLIDRFHHRLCQWTSFLVLLMVLVVFSVVVLRYVFNMGWIALQETAIYFHAAVFMLGAAYTLQADEHVRVDVLYRRFSPRGQAWVDFLGTLLLLLPVNVLIIWTSFDYVIGSWRLLETSQEAGGLPLVFILKSLLLVFPVTLILQGLTLAFKAGLTVFGKGEQD